MIQTNAKNTIGCQSIANIVNRWETLYISISISDFQKLLVILYTSLFIIHITTIRLKPVRNIRKVPMI